MLLRNKTLQRKFNTNLNTVFQGDGVKLSNSEEISSKLKAINCSMFAYDSDKNCLSTHFKFNSFSNAICFMNNVALVADKYDHHPDWSNIYDNIWVNLNTHTVQGVSEKDIYLAKAMENIFSLVNAQKRNYTEILVKDLDSMFK
jgi:4a-hydroxytetrahydrobiopterin dehydratase